MNYVLLVPYFDFQINKYIYIWLVLHLYMVIVFYFFHFVPLKFGSANTHAWSKMFELVIQTYANKMNHIHE